MHEILQVFIFSETLPRAVLELVSIDLYPFITVSGTTAPIDTDRLAKLLAPFLSNLPADQCKQFLARSMTILIRLVQSAKTTDVAAPAAG